MAEHFEVLSAETGRGVNSVLFAYSLGKAQRVLGLLHKLTKEPIYCHPAILELNECYRAQGIQLANTHDIDEVTETLHGALVLAPASFLKSERAHILGKNYVTAFASGWMIKNKAPYSGYDFSFVLSDHADWSDLVQTIEQTGARRIYVQHRGYGALVRYLRSKGLEAFPESALSQGVGAPFTFSQMELF